MPVHKTSAGHHDPLFRSLGDPLWAVDSRDYQITEPNIKKIQASGGEILCIEKFRPHIILERAIMSIRFNEAIVGMQFHPEADAPVDGSSHLGREKHGVMIPHSSCRQRRFERVRGADPNSARSGHVPHTVNAG